MVCEAYFVCNCIIYFSDPAPLLADDHGLEFQHDNSSLGAEEIYPVPPT